MRSTDEQLGEILRRAEQVRKTRSLRKRLCADAAAGLVCLVLLVLASAGLPQVMQAAESSKPQQYGSLLLTAPYTGYVLVGVLAFALGICVTLLCVHWKKLNQKEWKQR